MSISLRNRRVKVYQYDDQGADGVIDSKAVALSPLRYWASVVRTAGKEYTIGGAVQAIDAQFVFSDAAPVTKDSILQTDDDQLWRVVAVLQRDYGTHEVQVFAVYADAATYDQTTS